LRVGDTFLEEGDFHLGPFYLVWKVLKNSDVEYICLSSYLQHKEAVKEAKKEGRFRGTVIK